MEPPARIVACPTCRKPVHWSDASRYRPFCSERCRLIDLGAWAEEHHRIPAEDLEDTSEATDSRPTDE
jgi:uncharacterized protein